MTLAVRKALLLLFVFDVFFVFWATASCTLYLNLLLLAEKRNSQEEEKKKTDKNKQKSEEEKEEEKKKIDKNK